MPFSLNTLDLTLDSKLHSLEAACALMRHDLERKQLSPSEIVKAIRVVGRCADAVFETCA